VVTDEETRTTFTSRGVIVRAGRSGATVRVAAQVSTFDVPRRHAGSSEGTADLHLSLDSEPSSGARPDVVEAAMRGTASALRSCARRGQHWITQSAVTTTLGSGSASFEHTVMHDDRGLIEIEVRGHGTITGSEYHLPKLLPGAIELAGTAWYDPRSRLVIEESYTVHNTLLKPLEGEPSGFDERLTVDTTTRLTRAAQGPG